jgi:hypothetical protein
MRVRARNAGVHVGLQVYVAFPFVFMGSSIVSYVHVPSRLCASGKAGRTAQLLRS